MNGVAIAVEAGAPSLTFGLRDGGELRGALVMQGRRARITSEQRTWEITGRTRRLAWYGVALQPGAARADAAYYPHLGTGGTIAFESERYALRRRLVANRWRLRDEERHTVAGLSKQRAPLPMFTVELEPRARDEAGLWLLLLVAAWAILTEPDVFY